MGTAFQRNSHSPLTQHFISVKYMNHHPNGNKRNTDYNQETDKQTTNGETQVRIVMFSSPPPLKLTELLSKI